MPCTVKCLSYFSAYIIKCAPSYSRVNLLKTRIFLLISANKSLQLYYLLLDKLKPPALHSLQSSKHFYMPDLKQKPELFLHKRQKKYVSFIMFLLFIFCLLLHKSAPISPITMNQILNDSLYNSNSRDINIWQVIFNPKLSVCEAFYNHPASHLTQHYSQAPHAKSSY